MKPNCLRRSLLLPAGLILAGTAGCLAANSPAPATLPDVPSLLQQIQQLAGTPPAASSPASLLQSQLDEYHNERATLSDHDAASRWLQLYSSVYTLPQSDDNDNDSGNYRTELISALPPPSAWAELAKQVSALPAGDSDQARLVHVHLELLALALLNDRPGLETMLQKYRSATNPGTGIFSIFSSYRFSQLQNLLPRLQSFLVVTATDPEYVKSYWRNQLQPAGTPGGIVENDYGDQLPGPVAALGDDEAAKLLTPRIIAGDISRIPLRDPVTESLVLAIAQQQMPNLTKPLWQLTTLPGGTGLYPALLAKFGPAASTSDLLGSSLSSRFDSSSGSDQVTAYLTGTLAYALQLVTSGHTDQAVALLSPLLPSQPFQRNLENNLGFDYRGAPEFLMSTDLSDTALLTPQTTGALASFFLQLGQLQPLGPWLNNGLPFAVASGQLPAYLDFLAQNFTHPPAGATDAQRTNLQDTYQRALLAGGQLDQALALWRAEITNPPVVLPDDWQGQNRPFENALKVATIGYLLQKPDVLEEGLRAARTNVIAHNQDNSNSLADFYHTIGRPNDAFTVLTQALANKIRQQEQKGSNSFSPYYDSSSGGYLADMAELYLETGHPAEVVALLKRAPWWGVTDLKDLLTNTALHRPLGVIAADALFQTGQVDQAHAVLNAFFARDLSTDSSYELLLRMDGDDAMPVLDQLAAVNPYEKRPLIWKATLLLHQNKLIDAEAVIRQAIAIDPSDGWQGKGDRLRAFAVLGDILAARGQTAEADTMKSMVQAIRLSEQADDFKQIGLIGEAIKRYRQSLDLFDGAYCIQSRLALQLYQQGNFTEAEQHYRRAFELMPGSFGRIESHCFGCESVFEGGIARTVAEQVFTTYLKDHPDKPQASYLLGYLYSELNRPQDALPLFERAVALDPLYYNAWNKLADTAATLPGQGARLNDAQLTLSRLAPSGLFFNADVSYVTDLSSLWKIVAPKVAGNAATIHAPVYAFATSAQQLAATSNHPPPDLNTQYNNIQNAAQVLASQNLLNLVFNN
jgi:tetratricopeptide (TPR) repeat protein